MTQSRTKQLIATFTTALCLSVASASPVDDAFLHRYLIPAVAHGPGAETATWHSDVTLFNPGPDEALIQLFFLGHDNDNSDATGVSRTVPPKTSLFFEDVLSTLFELDGTTGAIFIGSTEALLVTSRTYSTGQEGSFGQMIPGYPVHHLTGNAPAFLVQLTDTERFRSNIGLASASAESVTVNLTFLSTNGAFLANRSVSLPPWGFTQLNRPLIEEVEEPVDNAWVLVTSSPSGAAVSVYGSIVDNLSQDPVFLPAIEPSDKPQWLAAAAHSEGVNGTSWRTDVSVANPGPGPASYRVELLPTGNANLEPMTAEFELGQGHSIQHDDLLFDIFAVSGVAALRVVPTAGRIVTTSRTYNEATGRTFGQHIPAQQESSATDGGEPTYVIHLASSATREGGFRTNIGAANPGAEPLTLTIEVFASDGTPITTTWLEVEARSQAQKNLFADLPAIDRSGIYARLTSATSGARFFAFASVVDNQSGDPFFITGSSKSQLALPLKAAFSWSPATPVVGQEIRLEDSSEGEPLSWSWDLGDETTASGTNISHAYSAPGSYVVELTISNGLEVHSVSHVVTVASPAWFSTCAEITTGLTDVATWIIDVNGDQLNDLLVTSNEGSESTVIVLRSDGEFEFTEVFRAQVPGAGLTRAVVADLNGDGLEDFAVVMGQSGSDASGLALFEHLDDGTFAFHPTGSPLQGPLELTAVDVDSDGDIDLIAPDFDIGYNVLVNLGDMEFVEQRFDDICEYLSFADVDGDSRVDLICGDVTELAVTLDILGNPQPLPAHTIAGGEIRGIRLRDLNGDGRHTILASIFVASGPASQNGRLDRLDLVDGTIVAAWSSTVFPGFPRGTQVCDIDGDDITDLLFSCGGVHVISSDGSDFEPATLTNQLFHDRFVCADLDGDTKVDVASGCVCDLEILCR